MTTLPIFRPAALALLAVSLLIQAGTPSAPKVPPDIQKILDKMKQHKPVSAAELKKLQEWTFRKTNETDHDASKAPTKDQNAFMPEDVQAIIARSQAGQIPSDAEQARLKAWAAETQANQAGILKDAAQTKALLEKSVGQGKLPPGTPDARPRGGPGLMEGTIVVEADQTMKGEKAFMEYHGTASFPVRYTLEDNGKDAPFRLGWWVDPERAYSLRFTGNGQAEHESPPDPCKPHGDHLTYQVQAGGSARDMMALLSGQVVGVPGRRSYTNATLIVRAMGPYHIDCPCKAMTEQAPPALFGLSLDGMRGDVPFNLGFGNLPVAAEGARIMDKLPPEVRGSIEAATFTFDPDRVRSGLAAGAPFQETATYHYKMGTKDGEMESTVHFRFIFGRTAEPELVVKVRGDDGKAYADWIPVGGTDEQTPGSHLKLAAVVVGKDHGALDPAVVAKKFTFQLTEVSHEPGVCLNLPSDSKGATSDDLAFRAADNPDFQVGPDGRTESLQSEDKPLYVEADLACLDYGAWGSLKVTVELEDGRVLEGHLEGQEGKPILLPKREAASHIADAWKKGREGADKADEDDSEEIAGNPHKGDGLSLYEEYRGLQAKGKHVTLNPAKQDLVVENEVGDVIGGGIALFEAGTRAAVVQVAKGELPASKIVNPNAGTAHLGDQMGLRVIQAQLDGDVIGDDGAFDLTALPESPADSPDIRLNARAVSGMSGGDGIRPASGQNGWDGAVAHELGHGVGLMHHGLRGMDPKSVLAQIKSGAKVELFDTDGSPLPVPDLTTDAGLAKMAAVVEASQVEDSDASGDVACFMCYSDLYAWALQPSISVYRFWKVPRPYPVQTGLCTGSAGTAYNAASHSPHSLFGPADPTVTPCMKRFRIKSYPKRLGH